MPRPETEHYTVLKESDDQLEIDVAVPSGKKRVVVEYDPDTDTYGTTMLPYDRYRSLDEIAFVLRRSHPDFGGEGQ